ncbi:MAG: Hsp20/alpha crystallin family protein [Vicinamibacterales bacterium]
MLTFPDAQDLSDDVRRVFEELDRRNDPNGQRVASLYNPPLDVVETVSSIEVILDVPGVGVDALRVFFKSGVLVIVGEKVASDACGANGSAFHLVERGFGRFARVIRLGTALDVSRARATLTSGELRVSVPRLEERRGREIAVTIHEQPR